MSEYEIRFLADKFFPHLTRACALALVRELIERAYAK
jgi:hypothetical protein